MPKGNEFSMSDIEEPYRPSSVGKPDTYLSAMKTFLQRFVAIFLFVAGWVCVGIATTTIATLAGGEIPDHRMSESELTALQSFQRFCVQYWFTAFIFLSPPVSILIWWLLKHNGIQRTRWLLLGTGLAISPLLIVVAWILFRPVLFR